MKKNHTLLILVLVSAFGTLQAQNISGLVKDEQGKALAKTTTSLVKPSDSSVIKLSITDEAGKYTFSVPAGKYLISVTYVGFTKAFSGIVELPEGGVTVVPDIILHKNQQDIGGVVVTAKKPMVEVKADKTILNIDGTINAIGSDALTLLRKSPGVMVDKDDNLSLAGKNGVQVFIDGKPSPLSGADLAAYLKALQSSEIDAIEIITNPSAKYEAAGNAGIINIRLKKNKAFGTNGSINSTYAVGMYGKYNTGLALNHRNKRINIFGNYNFNHGLNGSQMHLYREQVDTVFEQEVSMKQKKLSHGFKAGLDYFINKNNTIGVLINGNLSPRNTGHDYAVMSIAYIPTGIVDRVLVADNNATDKRNNTNFNINYRHTDSLGRELNVDADYGQYEIKSNQFQPNGYYTPDLRQKLNEYIYRFIAPSNINIHSLKSDYEQNFKQGRLGVGFKTSLVNTNNNFGSYDVKGTVNTLNLEKSNQFDYKENINALYVNYNRQFKGGFLIQLGVRAENTNITGYSYPLHSNGSVNKASDSSFKRKYTNFFPSAAFSFNKNPMNQWNLTYSRRIDRPAYQDLNPFEFKLNEYTFRRGNINLKPQYSNNITVSNTYGYKLNTSLTYSHVKDVFTQLIDTLEKSKSFMSKKNLATQNLVGINISYPFMYKAYTAFVNLSGNYSHYKADFGGGSRIINLEQFTYNIYMQHSIKFGKKKDWMGEVSGWYNSPSIWGGTFKANSLWTLDAGVQKTIFKGNGNFKLSVSDIFFTTKWKARSEFGGQLNLPSGSSESRLFKASISWRFGNAQVKAARQRKLSLEEENKRTQSGGQGIGGQ